VLLVERWDGADEEFEAFLLEVLSYAQVTVQFLGLGPQPSYSAARDSPKRPSADRSGGFPVFRPSLGESEKRNPGGNQNAATASLPPVSSTSQ
jgi:hypothetical protein